MTTNETIAAVAVGMPLASKILDVITERWQKKHDWFMVQSQELDRKRKELEELAEERNKELEKELELCRTDLKKTKSILRRCINIIRAHARKEGITIDEIQTIDSAEDMF